MTDKTEDREVASTDKGVQAEENAAELSGDTVSAEQSVEPSLEEQLDAATTERDQYFDQWKRAQAELDNYRKRVQKENEQNRQYSGMFLMRDLLPGLDNLDRAIKAAETSGNTDELVQGIQMVFKQFEDILARHSAVAIQAEGKPFDPNLHEAVQQIPSADHPPMTVLQVVERGFVLRDRVVRPAKVIVSAAPPGESPRPESAEAGPAEADSDSNSQ